MTAPKEYTVQVRVSLYDKFGSDRLEISEDLTLSAGNFMDVASILGKFHELAERLRAEKP